jgi:hypothetical protein
MSISHKTGLAPATDTQLNESETARQVALDNRQGFFGRSPVLFISTFDALSTSKQSEDA